MNIHDDVVYSVYSNNDLSHFQYRLHSTLDEVYKNSVVLQIAFDEDHIKKVLENQKRYMYVDEVANQTHIIELAN